MKKSLFLLLVVSNLVLQLGAQNQHVPGTDNVQWEFKSIKTGPGEFEVDARATIESGWHIYAQKQPKESIAVPTSIHFNWNPFVKGTGGTDELGAKKTWLDKALGVKQYYYEDHVVLIQNIRVKEKIKTSLKGYVTFQECTNEKCMPPKTLDFTIDLDNTTK